MFESAFERAGLALTVEAHPPPEPVYVDAEMWAKIVMNLLSNALKFTFTGGVAVKLAARDDHMELTVTDTGIGIAPDDQQHIFEEFRQVGQGTAKAEGTGLGLALTRRFVELHGGRIWVESELGVGSTFTFCLPPRQTPPAYGAEAAPSASASTARDFAS